MNKKATFNFCEEKIGDKKEKLFESEMEGVNFIFDTLKIIF